MKFFRKALFVLLLISGSATLIAGNIPLNHKYLHVEGAAYTTRTPEKLFYTRFSSHILSLPEEQRMFPAKTASSTSGIIISFKTRSSRIKLAFTQQPGLLENSIFKILRNGAEFKTMSFTEAEVKNGLAFTLDSFPDTRAAIYQIIMPSYSNLALTSLELSDHDKLLKYKPAKRKIYISYGDSITHGRGQDGATFLTYPYILSKKLGMTFFNQAVGSAKVSVPLAKEASHLPAADLISVLIGYNDLNGASKTSAQFANDYREFLTEIRKNQPKAKIYCITLLYTKKVKNERTGFTPEDFRIEQRKIFAELSRHDKNLFLIEGEKISSLANLKPGANTDGVHLTVEGARMLAEELAGALSTKF